VLLLIQLMLALFSIGASVEVEPVHGPVRFTDLYGSPREAVAATECRDGASVLWLSDDGLSLDVVIHELAHAHDCADNGEIDGSPGGRPDARPAWTSDYCWNSAAEWYACSVSRAGRIHPYPGQRSPVRR
jgi:hypothetical protein